MATRYPLNLPADLKQDAVQLARQQGISLNQFFLWSISEKVAELKASLNDPLHPLVTYRRGASGIPTPVIRGTGIRVETIVIAHRQGQSVSELAEDYELPLEAVEAAMSYYQAYAEEIDALIRIEQELEFWHAEA
jgi:uncharacterized protein (DUF433 family)